MTTVEGHIRVGEATAAASRIRKSQFGFPWYLAGLALIPLMAFGGYEAERLICAALRQPGSGGYLGMLAGIFIAGLAYRRVCRNAAVAQFRNQLAERGVPLEMPSRFELTSEHLVHYGYGTMARVEWAVVTEVFRTGRYWIFMAVASPFVVPSRFFIDQAAERTFLGEALSKMTPEARERSPDARTFAAAAI